MPQNAEKLTLNYGGSTRQDRDSLYCFYHIPKCGGMDFYNSMVFSIFNSQTVAGREIICGRVDSEQDLVESKAALRGITANYSSQVAPILGIIATHLGFKTHDKMLKDIRNIREVLILREPFSRLISAFCYDCMRRDHSFNINDFERYLMAHENRNSICKNLSQEYIKNTDTGFSKIISRIDDFYIFSTLSRQQHIIETILKNHGLANVLKGRINATLNKYCHDYSDLTDKFYEQFINFNKHDIKLYNRAEKHPIEPNLEPNTHLNSAVTVLLKPVQTISRYESQAHAGETDKMSHILENLNSYDSIEQVLSCLNPTV